MNKKLKNIILYILCLINIGCISITFLTVSKSKSKVYDKMVEASLLTKQCFETIKQYKIDNGIEISDQDIYECGMIGPYRSRINSSGGEIDAKLTSCNYNFAALYIKYFEKSNIKDGDEVAMMFSGSFPALNIAAICAAKVYNLKVVLMGSISGSNYGAIGEDFTFADMFHVLEINNLTSYTLDMVSAGSHDDNGTILYSIVKDDIVNRINSYGYSYIEFDNYYDNIQYRKKYIQEKLPNLKLFINVGAQTIGVGKNECDITTDNVNVGLIKGYYKPSKNDSNEDIGLVETYLNKGINVIHMLKLKQICLKENMTYNPSSIPSIGSEGCYYDNSYNLVLPTLCLSIDLIGGCLYIVYRVKKKKI